MPFPGSLCSSYGLGWVAEQLLTRPVPVDERFPSVWTLYLREPGPPSLEP